MVDRFLTGFLRRIWFHTRDFADFFGLRTWLSVLN